MKILLYNWVEPSNPLPAGGGVRIYLDNLLRHLSAVPDVDVALLASGSAYTLLPRHPFFGDVAGNRQQSGKQFQLWNSEVPAPSHLSFGANETLRAERTEAAFLEFIRDKGPFDLIHFHNLEGVPAHLLEALKEACPRTSLLLSLHNYYPICPQVNLWHQERERCTDYEGGRRCASCLPSDPGVGNALRYRRLSRVLELLQLSPASRLSVLKRFTQAYKSLAAMKAKVIRRPAASETEVILPQLAQNAAHFAQRRGYFVGQINRHVDKVLCVSARVAAVGKDHGIDEALLHVDYIGTEHAAKAANYPRKTDFSGEVLTIAYLGYMRADKGFFFLLDALHQLPPELASRLRVVVAAKATDEKDLANLKKLDGKVRECVYHNGYSHSDLDAILRSADIGVVPVLWEDSLPQVAIEMVSRGLPILTSNLGGAMELGGMNPDFIFRNGSIEQFTSLIRRLLDREVRLGSYWDNAMKLVTMEEHVRTLGHVYSEAIRERSDADAGQPVACN